MHDTLSHYTGLLYKEFFRYAGDVLLRETGLNYGAVPFIIYAGKFPGCTQAELTRGLGIDWGHSQRMIGKLSEAGFLSKTVGDGREHHIDLTEKGKKAYDVCHEVFTDFDREKLRVLTPEEKETLFSLLEKLADKDRKDGQS